MTDKTGKQLIKVKRISHDTKDKKVGIARNAPHVLQDKQTADSHTRQVYAADNKQVSYIEITFQQETTWLYESKRLQLHKLSKNTRSRVCFSTDLLNLNY